MAIPKIDNLEFREVTNNIFLVHQIKTRSLFSCCDGLLVLPKKDRNKTTIALDLNIEPKYIASINELYGPVSHYICSHCHFDHTSHVYTWEELGAIIHAPIPEAHYLLDLHKFYIGFGFDESLDYDIIESFGKLNGFQICKRVHPFEPGDSLRFEEFNLHTIPFQGHSKAHVGFLLNSEQILHISCMGFDKISPDMDGFGPWYGFKHCSISQYLEDITRAESIFLNDAKYLTSSHSYIVHKPNIHPFDYMRKKIYNNQRKVENALRSLNLHQTTEDKLVKQLLSIDLFFPKKKLKGFMLDIYRFWESWIIRKHIHQSEYFE
ncbi:hypothetical protein LCGC14_0784270 [marine sediment metagenome]|uniref:Metallo-beta-lactamase domain-containing protein n=1 Tax=marine sediment metagenome TaxID=412755 RepID=A0A0F9PYT5_9ZZZZ